MEVIFRCFPGWDHLVVIEKRERFYQHMVPEKKLFESADGSGIDFIGKDLVDKLFSV